MSSGIHRSIARSLRRLALVALLPLMAASAQSAKPSLYDPGADAAAALREATARAKREGRHVLVEIGGNWCRWCLKLDSLCRANALIDSVLQADYVFTRVNYSKENRNLAVLASLGYPQRFGFPVLVVLDGDGTRLHTQDSGLLEEGDRHSPEKVLEFLRNWSPRALDPSRYTQR